MKYWSNRIYVKKNSIFSAFLRDYWQHWSLLFESREAWNMIHGIMFVIFLWRNWMFWLDIMWHIDVSLTAQICGFNEKWKGKNNRALKAFPPSPPQPPPPKKNISHAFDVLLSSLYPSRFFSTFDMDKSVKNHQHNWEECFKIRKLPCLNVICGILTKI